MKKFIAFLAFIFFAFTMYLTISHRGMGWITKIRYNQIGTFKADKYAYGDLYGLSYLSKFKKIKDTNFVPLPEKKQNKLADSATLFILGDSYLYSYFKEDSRYYTNIDKVKFIRWSVEKPIKITPSTHKKNILLIESVERNMADLLNLEAVKARLDGESLPNIMPSFRQKCILISSEINKNILESLYHKTIEANIEFTWFNLGFLSTFKEIKADFNFNVFGRTDKEIAISKDQHFLYLAETINPENQGSSFSMISKEQLKTQVNELNKIQRYYKARGFDEVIFSIIPNPVAVLESENKLLNHVINRIKFDSNFQGVLINPTENLLKNASLNFFVSDSHWNKRGAKIWLDEVNKQLKN